VNKATIPAVLVLLHLPTFAHATGKPEADKDSPLVMATLHVSADNYIIRLDNDTGGHLIRAVYEEVFPGSSLWKHGVRNGDQIQAIDSREIRSYTVAEFRTLIQSGLGSGHRKVFLIRPGHRDLLLRRKPYVITFVPKAVAEAGNQEPSAAVPEPNQD
jgi:hypothetical protein